jgi:hypothetical protein
MSVNIRRSIIACAVGASLVAAAIAVWLTWPAPKAAPHARRYLNVTACLLTDPSGVAPGTAAARVWAAMQSASLTSHVMVSYLPDTGPADLPVMLNSLIERRCGVIIATGSTKAADRVIDAAKANPHQRFLLILARGSDAPARPANTSIVSAADASVRVGQVIRALTVRP